MIKEIKYYPYWYEYNFVKGKDNQVLYQVLKCNQFGDGKCKGITPVYSEWLK